jgi:hypothetical protein
MAPHAVDTQERHQLMQRLSPGERSVLAANLETPDSQIATVRNTPDDRLWSKMVEPGRSKLRQLLPTRAA